MGQKRDRSDAQWGRERPPREFPAVLVVWVLVAAGVLLAMSQAMALVPARDNAAGANQALEQADIFLPFIAGGKANLPATPTASITATGEATPAATGTATETLTPPVTPSATGTAAPSATPSGTPSATPTGTTIPTSTPTRTPSPTPSRTPSATPTRTPSATPTRTPTSTPTRTPPPTATATRSPGFTNCASQTGNNATVAVTAAVVVNGGFTFTAGDQIAIFNPPETICAGLATWTGGNIAITAWGDDSQTPAVDGLVSGQAMSFRIWDQSTGQVRLVSSATFSMGNGIYTVDSIHAVSSFTVAPAQVAQTRPDSWPVWLAELFSGRK